MRPATGLDVLFVPVTRPVGGMFLFAGRADDVNDDQGYEEEAH